MDARDVNLSLDMLLRTQNNADGCFNQVGAQLLSKALSGGLDTTSSTNIGLSAYVLISLLKATDSLNLTTNLTYSIKIQSGLECLKNSLFENDESLSRVKTHTLGLVLYAFKLADFEKELTVKINEELERRALVQNGFKYWTELRNKNTTENNQPYWIQSRSADLEITSYILLAKLNKYQEKDLSELVNVAKWINTQRNSLGGFYSTQDTVIALNALSEFSSAFYARNISMKIMYSIMNSNLVNKTLTSVVFINNRNRILTQVMRLDNMLENDVNVVRLRIEGEGTCLIQVV
jgi:hypothetical protein